MTGVKISALPVASAANAADQLEVNQGGTTRRVTVGQVTSAAPPVSVANTTLTNVDPYVPYLHIPTVAKSALYQEFDSSVVADNAAVSLFSAKNTGYDGPAIALLAEANAASNAGSSRAFGANIVGVSSIDGASVIGCEVDIVSTVGDYASAVGVLIASAGTATPNVALQMHANHATATWGTGILFHNRAGDASFTNELIKSDFNALPINYGVNFFDTKFAVNDWLSQNLQVTPGSAVASVNRISIKGGAAGVGCALAAVGSDSNIALLVQTKGTGVLTFLTGAVEQLRLNAGAGPDNLVIAAGAGVAALTMRGSTTNASITLQGKGTGGVRLIDGGGVTRLAVDTTGVSLTPVTVANLGTATAGKIAYVSDGTASLAWGATVTGGGATPYLVSANGTAWTVVGK